MSDLVEETRALVARAQATGMPVTAEDQALLANPVDGTDADGHLIDATYTLRQLRVESEQWLRNHEANDIMQWRINAAIRQSKAEILDDIEEGRFPAEVATFSELHEYVDANMYGGLCDEGHLPWGTEEDPNLHVNMIQNAIDAWLRAGRPES